MREQVILDTLRGYVNERILPPEELGETESASSVRSSPMMRAEPVPRAVLGGLISEYRKAA